MKRTLAITGAVVMVIVSIVIRSAIDDEGSTSSSARVKITCIPELFDACRSLPHVDFTIEDAEVTARKIADGTAQIDGWMTFDPWPAMTALLAQQDVARKTTPIASSKLTIAMVRERAAALAASCGGTVTWKCLGDDAGKQWSDLGGKAEWGTLNVALPSPSDAGGSLLLANAASSFFGRTDFATNDFTDEFRVWRAQLLTTTGTFGEFIQFFPAKFSAVGTIKASANAGARVDEVDFIDQGASAVVVLADLTGHVGNVAKDMRGLLTGWTDPTSTGLPDAGVVLALSGLTK